jgi:ATP-dependent RNA helicase RhlE
MRFIRKNPQLTQFTDFGLATPILQALAGEGYVTPTPIQTQAIPHVLAGRDLLGIAQTGTGKTAAFALPILTRLAADKRPVEKRTCRVLVLSPTRGLASQIAESFRTYGRGLGLSTAVVFGGVSMRAQIQALVRGVDILVATPGRLLDHLQQRTLQLGGVEVFVLDEADRMLDMGFIQPIRKIVRTLPAVHQNLFFSATMPKEIEALASDLLRDPVKVAVVPSATTVELIDQRVIMVDANAKRALLARILGEESMRRILVFTRTKHGADRVVRHLETCGIDSAAIHGNKSQGQRERALAQFRSGATRVLVATDIAARGIDVDDVSHVINFDLPNIPESYVHRIGRTARAGAAGIAISFCDGGEERAYLRDIEKLIRRQLPVTVEQRSAGAHGQGQPAPSSGHRDGNRNHGHNGKPSGNRDHGKNRKGDGNSRHGGEAHRASGARHKAGHHAAGNGKGAAGRRDDRRDGGRGPQRTTGRNASPVDMSTVGFMRTPR